MEFLIHHYEKRKLGKDAGRVLERGAQGCLKKRADTMINKEE